MNSLAAAAEESADAEASSGIRIFQGDGFELNAGFQAGFAALAVRNTGAGAGTRSRRDGSIIRSPRWTDGFVKPGLTGQLHSPEIFPGSVYGGLSIVSAWTLGDGDAYALPGGTQATRGQIAYTDLESLYLGWRSAAAAGRTADGIDISAGRQEFVIGDGFLIGDGHYDRAKDAGYYAGGRLAWTNSGLVRVAALPWRADLFWLEGDKNSGGSGIFGANLEFLSEGGTLGAAWMKVATDDEAQSGYSARRGMQIFDLRGQGHPLPFAPDLFIAAEWGYETNNSVGRRQRASAWYGEIGYTWSSLPGSPSLSYRHARFSGDKASTATDESWDPLRYGASRGWGTWYMGEIAGEYMLFNSNETVHMLHARLQPTAALGVGAIFYLFRYDRADSVTTFSGATGVGSAAFGREIDLYADWTPLPFLTVSAVVGFFTPGAGAREAYGSGRNTALIETVIGLRF